MRGAILALAVLGVAGGISACHKAPKKMHGGLPPMPPYQMRAQAPPGDRLAPGRDGQALFSHVCGYCHLAGGMGTNVLTAQMVAAHQPPAMGLLANRTDLRPEYVQWVVRNGKGAMPRQSRVDVTDAELDSIAAYLAKAKK
ncbi:MAG TPA: cytochrome c [Caulobacteraceae bacterium]